MNHEEVYENIVTDRDNQMKTEAVDEDTAKMRQMKRFGFKIIEAEKLRKDLTKIDERILWVLENEPHLPRLQSKVCRIISDH